ncbi:MAG TPA: PepSY domain-containing protein [Candidatus Eisenbergiella intestinipullorum]|nr:PepSY domain-containing protein [Candidatus Eisenbergiella intestinipullorum]
MKKKIYACTAALILSAAALAACSGQSSGTPVQTQSIAAGQETASAGTQDTALNVSQSVPAETAAPSAGESVAIAARPSDAQNAFISEADAKKAAFDHAGVTEADVTGLRVKLDYDDGRQVYDVEFYSGSQEYDYEISADDGSVLSFDQEMDDWARAQSGASGTQSSGSQGVSISEADAKSLALAQVPGATEENITKFGQDRDDGRTVYEIEILYDFAEYDIEIDANTGEIVKLEKD